MEQMVGGNAMERIVGGGILLDGDGATERKDSALLIRDGLIADIGSAETLRCVYPDADFDFDANRLILPGFINAHDHGRGLSPFRFGARDCALELWIPQLMRVCAPTAQAAYYDGLKLASSGVTTVVHCHNIGNADRLTDELVDTAIAYNRAGIRVALCPPFTDQNSLIYADRDAFAEALPSALRTHFLKTVQDAPISLPAYFGLIEELNRRLAKEIAAGMVSLQLHPVGVQWCSDRALYEIAAYARAHHMSVHMHMSETQYQQIYAKRRWDLSTVAHLQEIGFLGLNLTCAHAVWVDDDELDLLAEAGVTIATNPSSNLRLRSGVMPLSSALARGIDCGVGIDGCGLDDDQDYCRELRMAYFNMKYTDADVASAYKPADILRTAYEGGRKATANQLSGGRLRKGERADFVCFDFNRLRSPYCDDGIRPAELVVQAACRADITEVYCAGERIAADGNQAAIASAGKELGDAIRERTAGGETSVLQDELTEAIASFYRQWKGSNE
jgi:cytosine/adenosine deaminase-related metal-dependent hydrolase